MNIPKLAITSLCLLFGFCLSPALADSANKARILELTQLIKQEESRRLSALNMVNDFEQTAAFAQMRVKLVREELEAIEKHIKAAADIHNQRKRALKVVREQIVRGNGIYDRIILFVEYHRAGKTEEAFVKYWLAAKGKMPDNTDRKIYDTLMLIEERAITGQGIAAYGPYVVTIAGQLTGLLNSFMSTRAATAVMSTAESPVDTAIAVVNAVDSAFNIRHVEKVPNMVNNAKDFHYQLSNRVDELKKKGVNIGELDAKVRGMDQQIDDMETQGFSDAAIRDALINWSTASALVETKALRATAFKMGLAAPVMLLKVNRGMTRSKAYSKGSSATKWAISDLATQLAETYEGVPLSDKFLSELLKPYLPGLERLVEQTEHEYEVALAMGEPAVEKTRRALEARMLQLSLADEAAEILRKIEEKLTALRLELDQLRFELANSELAQAQQESPEEKAKGLKLVGTYVKSIWVQISHDGKTISRSQQPLPMSVDEISKAYGFGFSSYDLSFGAEIGRLMLLPCREGDSGLGVYEERSKRVTNLPAAQLGALGITLDVPDVFKLQQNTLSAERPGLEVVELSANIADGPKLVATNQACSAADSDLTYGNVMAMPTLQPFSWQQTFSNTGFSRFIVEKQFELFAQGGTAVFLRSPANSGDKNLVSVSLQAIFNQGGELVNKAPNIEVEYASGEPSAVNIEASAANSRTHIAFAPGSNKGGARVNFLLKEKDTFFVGPFNVVTADIGVNLSTDDSGYWRNYTGELPADGQPLSVKITFDHADSGLLSYQDMQDVFNVSTRFGAAPISQGSAEYRWTNKYTHPGEISITVNDGYGRGDIIKVPVGARDRADVRLVQGLTWHQLGNNNAPHSGPILKLLVFEPHGDIRSPSAFVRYQYAVDNAIQERVIPMDQGIAGILDLDIKPDGNTLRFSPPDVRNIPAGQYYANARLEAGAEETIVQENQETIQLIAPTNINQTLAIDINRVSLLTRKQADSNQILLQVSGPTDLESFQVKWLDPDQMVLAVTEFDASEKGFESAFTLNSLSIPDIAAAHIVDGYQRVHSIVDSPFDELANLTPSLTLSYPANASSINNLGIVGFFEGIAPGFADIDSYRCRWQITSGNGVSFAESLSVLQPAGLNRWLCIGYMQSSDSDFNSAEFSAQVIDASNDQLIQSASGAITQSSANRQAASPPTAGNTEILAMKLISVENTFGYDAFDAQIVGGTEFSLQPPGSGNDSGSGSDNGNGGDAPQTGELTQCRNLSQMHTEVVPPGDIFEASFLVDPSSLDCQLRGGFGGNNTVLLIDADEDPQTQAFLGGPQFSQLDINVPIGSAWSLIDGNLGRPVLEQGMPFNFVATFRANSTGIEIQVIGSVTRNALSEYVTNINTVTRLR